MHCKRWAVMNARLASLLLVVVGALTLMGNGLNEAPSRPPWDQELADSYTGKYILVGITYLDHEGKELRKQQLHGVIESALQEKGIKIQLKGVHQGESWVMMPDLSA